MDRAMLGELGQQLRKDVTCIKYVDSANKLIGEWLWDGSKWVEVTVHT
jgi:hypothetical protein